MAAWKQILVALLVLVVAAAAWLRFYPGAPDVLARWGIDWVYAAAPPHAMSLSESLPPPYDNFTAPAHPFYH